MTIGFMVAGLLQHESSGWEQITALLDARADEVLHTNDQGEPQRASDVYAHLERWMTANIPRVEAFLADGPGGAVPDLPASVDELNARWAQEDRDVAFAEARRRAFLARDRFMAQMRTVPLDRWTARLVGLYHGNGLGHYQEHLGYLGSQWMRYSLR